MKITGVTLFRVHGHYDGPVFPPGERQARALDLYPEFNTPAGAGYQSGSAIQALYVEIKTDEGVDGCFGPIEEWQAFHIHRTLRPFLTGRDPLAGELLYDQMIRMDRHGRSGLFMTAISAVDCALWDLRGKAWGQPVYRLLGGPTRAEVPAYASMLGFATTPEAAAEMATEYKAQGYTAQKWFFRYGPGDGSVGLEKNLAMAQAVRSAVGPHYPLMFDAFMGWDMSYATKMVRELAQLHPTWMEEPVPPERVSELRKLRNAAAVPIATGEHIYTRWQTKELLVNEAVDVLQNDPDWTGGITEQVKICALASAFEVPVVAHGHSLLPALHVAGAQSPAAVPFVEYLVRYQESKQFFHQPFYRPEAGSVTLPTLPGLGLVLNETKVERREEVEY
ncbi:MAG: mandelate racemase/muconate lactonizing protein [Chloroflexi bacterium]|nr:MAG: mandelate racemase/muconate lactonizing protein [Chloroflexota bacterium]